MRRSFLLALVAVGLLAFAACGRIQEQVDAGIYERIHRQLVQMESFSAQATVTYFSNSNTHTYETAQFARASGEYRIEVIAPANVAGNVTVFDGSVISQFNPRLDGRISQLAGEAPERLEILITSFVRNFVRSQEVSVVAASLDEAVTTVLEAPIPGEHPYLATSRLWVCNESLLPLQITIYDNAGVERITVVYSFFEFDTSIADEMFMVWNPSNLPVHFYGYEDEYED